MKNISILGLLVLASCAWSQAEFRKWSQKDDATTANNQLEKVGVKAEEAEKFAVQDVPAEPAAVVGLPVPPAKTTSKPAPTIAKIAKKVPPVPKSPAPKVPLAPQAFAYPADVPDEVRKLDERSEVAWKKFQPTFTANEVAFLDVDYLGMTVGKVSMAYKGIKLISGKEVYHFQARFKTAPFYSALYELDDTINTYVTKKDFLGQRYNLIQRESKQNVDEVQLYDQETLRTTAYQKRVKDGKTKNKTWEGPLPRYNLDSFSAIYLIRGLPLNPGDSYAVTLVNKAKLLVLELKVELKEKISVKGKNRNTIRVHAFTKYSGSTLKNGDMTFWLADSPGRELLRAKANIKIGAVYLEASDGE